MSRTGNIEQATCAQRCHGRTLYVGLIWHLQQSPKRHLLRYSRFRGAHYIKELTFLSIPPPGIGPGLLFYFGEIFNLTAAHPGMKTVLPSLHLTYFLPRDALLLYGCQAPLSPNGRSACNNRGALDTAASRPRGGHRDRGARSCRSGRPPTREVNKRAPRDAATPR